MKARDSIRRHGRRLVELGKISVVDDLVSIYGWDTKQLAHDFQHAYQNGCPFCREPFANMAHGLSDVTIDIVDRNREPFYRTNTRIACMTCNRAKGDMSPDEFEEHQLGWRICSEATPANPQKFLFDIDPEEGEI